MEKIRAVTNLLAPKSCLILLFHGVIKSHESKVRNYTRKHIEVGFFSRLLDNLLANGAALSMDQCVEYKNQNKAYPDNSFVLTFDDGFENNFSVAAPVLEAKNIPAAFYVSTDFIENNTMSWIDRIEYMVDAVKPKQVQLPWESFTRKFSQGSWPEFAVDFLIEIRRKVKSDPSVSPDTLIQTLAQQWSTKPPNSAHSDLDQKMSWKQVKDLATNPLFTVGGHSHHHLNLAFLNSKEMKNEIDTSLRLLNSHIGKKTLHYCYPEGLENCYNENVIEHLKLQGIVASPTAIEGTNTLDMDLFHLRRVMVTDA